MKGACEPPKHVGYILRHVVEINEHWLDLIQTCSALILLFTILKDLKPAVVTEIPKSRFLELPSPISFYLHQSQQLCITNFPAQKCTWSPFPQLRPLYWGQSADFQIRGYLYWLPGHSRAQRALVQLHNSKFSCRSDYLSWET